MTSVITPLRDGVSGGAIRAASSTASATLQTTGSGSLIDALAAVYGADVAAAAIEIDAPPAHEGEVGVRGVVVDPRLHRSSRNYIGLYVNRRWVRNRALTFAVEEAYQGMLPVGRHPIAVLDLRIPPDDVDVNVHPTKAEVRLRQRARRCSACCSAPCGARCRTARPCRRRRRRSVVGRRLRAVRAAAAVPDAAAAAIAAAVCARRLAASPSPARGGARRCGGGAAAATMIERLPLLRAVGQVGNTYVIAEGPDGMYLVDQHAAHERVLYERFLAARARRDAGRAGAAGAADGRAERAAPRAARRARARRSSGWGSTSSTSATRLRRARRAVGARRRRCRARRSRSCSTAWRATTDAQGEARATVASRRGVAGVPRRRARRHGDERRGAAGAAAAARGERVAAHLPARPPDDDPSDGRRHRAGVPAEVVAMLGRCRGELPDVGPSMYVAQRRSTQSATCRRRRDVRRVS